MPRSFVTLDVFTDTPFTGNPLAVVLRGEGLSGSDMQTIAREFNLSETTFVLPPEDPKNTAKVRIFTPNSELPFAGHPTIGTAVALALQEKEGSDDFQMEIRLEENAGLVPVKITAKPGFAPHGVFSAPVMPSQLGDAPDTGLISAALGLDDAEIGFANHVPGLFSAGVAFLFIPVKDLDSLARAHVVQPAWDHMMRGLNILSAYIYSAGGEADFQSRLFAPGEGISEDPATGAAAATFPGQIMACEALGDGRYSWKIAQGVEMGRPSRIVIEASISKGEYTSVQVGGQATIIQRGEISI